MGTYCEVYLNGYQIDSTKSYINPFYSALFNENDKRSRKVSWEIYYTEQPNRQRLVPTYEYVATARVLKSRLQLLGFTLEDTKQLYATSFKEHVKGYREFLSRSNDNYGRLHVKRFLELQKKGLGFWLKLVRQIMDSGIQTWDIERDRDREKDDLATFILDLSTEEFWLGFPSLSYGHFLRAILEAADNDHELILDITPLVNAGYYGPSERICEMTAQSHVTSINMFQKIILLTEGKSDKEFLYRTLRILHPELEHYFSFLEFDQLKADGGSAALERNVKAFAAAGIGNKVVALFDNDAAGLSSIDRLNNITLPSNINVLALPNLSFAESYPTRGAQGTTLENINGRACSIEMYFGAEILNSRGVFTPVVWKGMEEKIKAYQGELEQKSELQRRFREKLDITEKYGIKSGQDWSAMDSILQSIFKVVAARPYPHASIPD